MRQLRTRNRLLAPVVLLLWPGISLVLADEWGNWDDLPDNLLESQNDIRSLEELSQQLDQLIADRVDTAETSQERLLGCWLNQLAPEDRKTLSLDTLLSIPEDWTDDQFETWYESLGNGSGNSFGNGSGNGLGNGSGNGLGNGAGAGNDDDYDEDDD